MKARIAGLELSVVNVGSQSWYRSKFVSASESLMPISDRRSAGDLAAMMSTSSATRSGKSGSVCFFVTSGDS